MNETNTMVYTLELGPYPTLREANMAVASEIMTTVTLLDEREGGQLISISHSAFAQPLSPGRLEYFVSAFIAYES